MRLPVVLLATAALALPEAVLAQPIEGLYVGGAGGYNILQDEHVRPSTTLGYPSGSRLEFDGGGVGLGSVGYAFGNGFRVELEGDWMSNALRQRAGAATPATAGGSQDTYGLMVNGLFDLDIGSRYVFPYLGLGLGYQATEWNGLSTHAPSNGNAFTSDSTAGGLGTQAIFGFAFPVPDMPGLSVTADYRFLGVIGPQRFDASVDRPGLGTVQHGSEQITENLNNILTLGLRYAFHVTPPPPPPAPAQAAAPAPAPARTYLVFFDWDRADLTDRARQIVGEAAQASTHVQYTRIEVDGYTDRSGSPAYNQKLSVRRAEAVAAELVRDGVPKNVIDIQGFGETHPLVPTAAGVREPQNRRVEIDVK